MNPGFFKSLSSKFYKKQFSLRISFLFVIVWCVYAVFHPNLIASSEYKLNSSYDIFQFKQNIFHRCLEKAGFDLRAGCASDMILTPCSNALEMMEKQRPQDYNACRMPLNASRKDFERGRALEKIEDIALKTIKVLWIFVVVPCLAILMICFALDPTIKWVYAGLKKDLSKE